MGGLFKAPQPAAVPPEPVAATPAAIAQTVDTAATEARAEARSRARRGLAGTIATSARGVLDPVPTYAAARKTLLGE